MVVPWWRHELETFSALLTISAVTGEFPAQRPVTRSFDILLIFLINGWVNNGKARHLRRYRANYEVTVRIFPDHHFSQMGGYITSQWHNDPWPGVQSR